MAQLEHVNVTVSDAHKTAAWMAEVFGWHIRWEGPGMDGAGLTVHCGSDDSYVALYQPKDLNDPTESNYTHRRGLNHIAVTVDNLSAAADRVRAAGFTPGEHYDYEPGERFYFDDHDGIEFEVVSYP